MPKWQFHTIIYIYIYIYIYCGKQKDFTEHKRKRTISHNLIAILYHKLWGVLASLGVKTGWQWRPVFYSLFLAKNHKMAKLPQNFWRKFPLFFFPQKDFSKLLPILGEHVVTSQSVSLSTGHNYNDPVQKVSPVKAKSVWICLGIIASVATVQKGKKQRLLASIPRQIESDFARLATLLFQGTLKTEASRHKCGDSLPSSLPPSPQKNNLLSLLRNLKWRNLLLFLPLCSLLVARNFF